MSHPLFEDVWITGIGLVSSLGEGCDEHWESLNKGAPVIDSTAYAPYPVHPLGDIDFSKQVPKRGDLRQMGRWQQLGVYAAGMALSDADVAGESAYLDTMDMIVAADGGERDEEVDRFILQEMAVRNDPEVFLNEALSTQLRPTLFLAQLPNLMAGNISIVHKVAGSSRTFMGEEMAGVTACQVAMQRIRAGQSRLCLVGGAYNAEREDMQLLYELGRYLWPREYRPVWERHDQGGGIITGTVGAFLVLEAAEHAKRRGVRPYACIREVRADHCKRQPEAAANNAMRQFDGIREHVNGSSSLAVISGSCGSEPVTSEECLFYEQLSDNGYDVSVRAAGSMLGHCAEAQFPAGIALAALAASKGELFGPGGGSAMERSCDVSPGHVLVTSWGHWRGEGMALVEPVVANADQEGAIS